MGINKNPLGVSISFGAGSEVTYKDMKNEHL